ncbi:aconitate hydratase AcnA [Microbacterium terrisoli]|uniref:aconitate hydratase AcnA n=1 Tax=Microbacterium terrisoli TaxID=3242192 RepID=UPI002803DA10|nr:aconitate hydratase AcnA [Microbacterium protaetiae]
MPDLESDELTTEYGSYRIASLDGVADDRLPYAIRILLENVLRNQDGHRVTPDQIDALAGWGSDASFATPIELTPSRAFLHDTNGVPALVDLATMRDAMADLGGDPATIGPRIPAELVVDHSVIADFFGTADARERNVDREYERNAERYRFLKWGQNALDGFEVVPPGAGIMHQVNLERLARVVIADGGWAYPDVCLGTDSHTTMINGLGVLGWGVGGIDAEAVMLGETFGMLVPRVVGFRLTGALPAGTTATDLVLTVTQLLRAHGVVGSFVEFFGEGVAQLTLADRATIANMSPESGATCIYFPIDDETIRYLRFTGRSPERVALVEAYAKRQGLWHRPDRVADYTEIVELDLSSVTASLAGPRRPQDRVPLTVARDAHRQTLPDLLPAVPGGPVDPAQRFGVDLGGDRTRVDLGHGAVAIAAITSCTNTSNPAVMIAAGLFARNAVAAGLRTKPWVKTTLSPGSLVVTEYLQKAGLSDALDALGFTTAGYGCMTCIGASGPLIPAVQDAVREQGIAVAAVLSGNRNFDGRINPDVRMNYLASPPLVIAYALAGTMDIDLVNDPLGVDAAGRPLRLGDLWPAEADVATLIEQTLSPAMFTEAYRDVFAGDERWRALQAPDAAVFDWEDDSTYLRRPPFFDGMAAEATATPDLVGARVLALLGDSITTDHISPAGAIPAASVAGRYLAERGVAAASLNTYASRRGNHEVMMRGCFANVRLRNRLVPGVEGGYTRCFVDGGRQQTIFDAARAYRAAEVPLVVIGGKEYGTGSSRDWAAKAPALLGVRVVLAESFERIHRSNLIGMGVLPLQFLPGDSAESLGLTGEETIDVLGIDAPPPAPDAAGHTVPARVTVRADEKTFEVNVRLDTPRERELYRHGGVMKYVLRHQLGRDPGTARR